MRLEYIRYNTQFYTSVLDTVCWCYHYNPEEENLLSSPDTEPKKIIYMEVVQIALSENNIPAKWR